MNGHLSKQEKKILENLDKLLSDKEPSVPSCYLEEKIFQVIKKFEYTAEKHTKEQKTAAELMSNISHQIKTPLSALSLHLELASDDSLTLDERAEELSECRGQMERLKFLSESLFKIARLESGLISVRKTNADIVETVMSAVNIHQNAMLSKGLELLLQLPHSLMLPHDPIWTKEAVFNLLDNAVKYTGEGKITVSLEKGAIYTQLDIIDTGIGVSPEDYAKIFTRFYRARYSETERTEGTGLGLTIAREILRQQGGNITVSSVRGKGSIFTIFFQNS